MTLTPATPAGENDRVVRSSPPPTRRLARVWELPLWAHAIALAVVLVALLPLLGPGSLSADEGAAMVQARHLSRGNGWIVDHPLPTVDPDGRAYPLELSERGARGSAPFAKHPLYALLLAGADRVGGATAMALLSLAGTVAAAALAAALGGHLEPALRRPSLWVAGLATPLFFDGYVVIAHTVAAVFAVGAVVLTLRLLDGAGRDRRPAVTVAGIVTCVALGVLLRSEALFWGIALGVVLGAVAIRRRSALLVGAAVASVVAAYGARLGEHSWITRIVGDPVVATGDVPRAGAGFLGDRLATSQLTWLAPGYGRSAGGALALVIMLGAVVVGAVAVRRVPDDRRAILLLAATAAVAAMAAVVVAPSNLVPGLLVTSPVLAAGLVALRRSTLTETGARLALATFVLFAAAVAATQYTGGGSVEWGGRYFALGLPVLVPVVVLALTRAGRRLDRATRRCAAAALVVCAVAMGVMAMGSLGAIHRRTDRLTAAADRAGRQVAPGGRPVMVATTSSVPRLAWATFERQRWLIARPDDLGELVDRLRVVGVADMVLVSRDLARDRLALGGAVDVTPAPARSDQPPIGANWDVVVVHLRP
ncbi:MAG: hypothetical protein ACR2GF_06925 [Acidimicrobiales bacterium]